MKSTGWIIHDKVKFASSTIVLKMVQNGMSLPDAIKVQASKFPSGLKQYWADLLLLICTNRINRNDFPKERKKRVKRKNQCRKN